MKFGYTSTFYAEKGKEEELGAILVEASELMKKAKGCHLYAVGKVKEKSGTYKVFEIWDSKADHDASINLPGVRSLIDYAFKIMDEGPEGFELELIHGATE